MAHFKYLLLAVITLICGREYAQNLPVPTRSSGALEGSQVISAITNLSLQNRELYILNEVLSGNIQDFQRNMISVVDSALISGTYKHVEYYVIPDYIALGSNTDYYLCPMTPILAQRLADSLDCILPTRKMVNTIWSQATVKMQPESIPPSAQMTTVPVMSDHNDMVWTQRQTFFPTHLLGELVSGDKKDVVIGNLIYTSAAPARVVIYGWHYQNGTNIQPLYAGHIDTYADYSHGIRFVQREMYLDGVPTDAQTILGSSSLYTLLSDEGVISQAYYPDTASGTTTTTPPVTPRSFAVLSENNNAIRIKITPDNNVDDYSVYLSSDGNSFNLNTTSSNNDFVISGLNAESIYYVKLVANNTAGASTYSEVLGAVTTDSSNKYLVVNGFDRASTGNTYNFIRQHGQAIFNDTLPFSSATNEAITNGLISLINYPAVDYILGEESTADETFNATEQTLIKNYMDAGGYLFVSGAEIGWDLDHLGNTNDQFFYNNYLKADYVDDAPGGIANTYYDFTGLTGGIFENFGSASFDDGSNGTYNVDYPDVLLAVNGASNIISYDNLATQLGGVSFEGLFSGGSLTQGKLVHLGFPFETIYPESKRFEMMESINDFFFPPAIPDPSSGINNEALIFTFYPNPTNGLINFSTSLEGITVYNNLGQIILSENNTNQIDLSFAEAGLYLISCQNQGRSKSLKVLISR